MKGGRPDAERLIVLRMSGKQRRNGRRNLITGGGQHPGGLRRSCQVGGGQWGTDARHIHSNRRHGATAPRRHGAWNRH